MFPVISNPATNIMKLNDKIYLDRNKPYSRDLFTTPPSIITMYDNFTNMKKYDVKNVTVALYEREGKQYVSNSDTISTEALKEFKKIRSAIPVYIKVEAMSGKSKKVVWNKIIVYAE